MTVAEREGLAVASHVHRDTSTGTRPVICWQVVTGPSAVAVRNTPNMSVVTLPVVFFSQLDILCNEEILGKDHTLKFVVVTRWRFKVTNRRFTSTNEFKIEKNLFDELFKLLVRKQPTNKRTSTGLCQSDQ